MARTVGPLLSLDASGSVAGALTFAKWKGRGYVRQLVTPSNPRSGGQFAQRAMMRFLSQAWANFSAAEQAAWDALAAATNVSAFNAMVAYNMNRWTQFSTPLREPGVTGAASLPTFTTPPAGVGGVGQITISWDILAMNAGWGMYMCLDPANGAAETKDLVRLIPEFLILTADQAVISGLAAGTYSLVYEWFDDLGNKFGPPGSAQNNIVVT